MVYADLMNIILTKFKIPKFWPVFLQLEEEQEEENGRLAGMRKSRKPRSTETVASVL